MPMWWDFFRTFDAFPKVDQVYLQQTKSGAITTIICYILIGALVVGELMRYLTPTLQQYFVVDSRIAHTITMTLDISIATDCSKMMVFVADQTGASQSVDHWLDFIEEDFGAIAGHVTGATAEKPTDSPSDSRPGRGSIGCRVQGSIPITKADGRLSIVPVMSAYGPLGALLAARDRQINFSHYIHRLSFGADFPESANPLVGTNQLALHPHERFLYFLSIIPTDYRDRETNHYMQTNQYALTGLQGKQGNGRSSAGLVFFYKLEPLEIMMVRQRTPFFEFFVRLAGIMGGIYTCIGIIHHLVQWVLRRADDLRRGHDKPSTILDLDGAWSPILVNNQK